jgi:hypothetical protein
LFLIEAEEVSMGLHLVVAGKDHKFHRKWSIGDTVGNNKGVMVGSNKVVTIRHLLHQHMVVTVLVMPMALNHHLVPVCDMPRSMDY